MRWELRLPISRTISIAMPAMADLHFSHTLTYVCEHSAEGALGIVVKPTDMTLSALREDRRALADAALRRMPVKPGGPVQVDRGFVLHRPLGNWQSTLASTTRSGSRRRRMCSKRSRAARVRKTCWCRWATPAGRRGSSSRRLRRTPGSRSRPIPAFCSKRPSRRGYLPPCAFSASISRACPTTSDTHDAWRPPGRTTKPRSSRSISGRAGSALRSAT